jgi:hypothetical protein
MVSQARPDDEALRRQHVQELFDLEMRTLPSTEMAAA